MTDHSKAGDQQTQSPKTAPQTPTDSKVQSEVDRDQKIDAYETSVEELEAQLKSAQESHLRTQADYQNLQRRTREEKQQWIKLATKEFVSALLEPLDHLGLAAEQIKDQGLEMTIGQLWERLREQGLEEINPVGQSFDVHTMDAVGREGDGEIVLSVVKKGYVLNGEVIQHAKVIVGSQKVH